MPVSIDGASKTPAEIIAELNQLVGSYGWGRIDMVENRRVGIKSRETYECPASLALIKAHIDLESICLERDLQRENYRLDSRYAARVYAGPWLSPLREALGALFIESPKTSTDDVAVNLAPTPHEEE